GTSSGKGTRKFHFWRLLIGGEITGAAAQRHPDPNPAGIPPSAYIERFSCTFRTEVLDRFVFTTLDEVRHMAEDLCHCYSRQRPH
ncbi:integrase core domain-containing protein, partial [Xanthomonas euvesicatoria]|uniref:integrase core domain-containing protein n=1 Tax=Xanthomonas euvesicatoria TaxID=456327 RepID=UPI001C484F6C